MNNLIYLYPTVCPESSDICDDRQSAYLRHLYSLTNEPGIQETPEDDIE
jgi:hypothetical protein